MNKFFYLRLEYKNDFKFYKNDTNRTSKSYRKLDIQYISDLDLFYKDPNADPDPATQVRTPQKSVPTVFRGIWS